MILRGILRGIMFVVDGIAKILAWLLVALGLWLPALYSFVFVITCAVSNIPLMGNTITMFWLGFVISCIGSMLLALRHIKKEKEKKESVKTSNNMFKLVKKDKSTAVLKTGGNADALAEDVVNQSAGENSFNNSVDNNDDGLFREENIPKNTRQQENRKLADTLADNQKVNYARKVDANTNINNNANTNNNVNPNYNANTNNNENTKESVKNAVDSFLPYNTSYLDGAQNEARAEENATDNNFGGKTTEIISEEKPIIFRLKADPTVFVYEYENRLDFYKRTRQGLLLMKTTKK